MRRTDQNKKHRQAEFLEQSRQLVSLDRFNRQYKVPQDFAKTLASALERAYQRGLKEAQTPPTEPQPNEHYLDWIQIPSRSREAFQRICFDAVLHSETTEDLCKSVLCSNPVSQGTSDCWVDQTAANRTWGKTTIAPLTRLNLLTSSQQYDDHLFLTLKGVITYLVYAQSREPFADYVARFYATEHGSAYEDIVDYVVE